MSRRKDAIKREAARLRDASAERQDALSRLATGRGGECVVPGDAARDDGRSTRSEVRFHLTAGNSISAPTAGRDRPAAHPRAELAQVAREECRR